MHTVPNVSGICLNTKLYIYILPSISIYLFTNLYFYCEHCNCLIHMPVFLDPDWTNIKEKQFKKKKWGIWLHCIKTQNRHQQCFCSTYFIFHIPLLWHRAKEMGANFTRPGLWLDRLGQEQRGDRTNDLRASWGIIYRCVVVRPGKAKSVCVYVSSLCVRSAISVLFPLMSRTD